MQKAKHVRQNSMKNMLKMSRNHAEVVKEEQNYYTKVQKNFRSIQKNTYNIDFLNKQDYWYPEIFVSRQNLLRKNKSQKNYYFENMSQNSKQDDLQNLPPSKRYEAPKKHKDLGYDRLSSKMQIFDQKFAQIRSGLIRNKSQKEKIIKQQIQERQRIQKQRLFIYQIQQIQKQKSVLQQKLTAQKYKNKQNSTIKLHIENQYSTALRKQNQPLSPRKNLKILDNTMSSPREIHLLNYCQNNSYYISELIRCYKNPKSLFSNHFAKSLKYIKFLQSYKFPSQSQISFLKKHLIQKPQYFNKKTLVFDLDETLIHYSNAYDSGKQTMQKVSIRLKSGTFVQIEINVRPHARNILRNLHKTFQIMIFTASQRTYADPIINYLDPLGEYVSHRLYRENCYKSPSGLYIKDLRILNRPLSDVVIVDNSAYSYFFQLDNAIPIVPYTEGSSDRQLKELESFLKEVSELRDVRTKIRETFKLNQYGNVGGCALEKAVQQVYLGRA